MAPVKQRGSPTKSTESTRAARRVSPKPPGARRLNKFALLGASELTEIKTLSTEAKDFDTRSPLTKRNHDLVARQWDEYMAVNGVSKTAAWTIQHATVGM
ncbi:hypothetical protein BC936DRAFT_146320 [Jimgerdemannia flammicorona]|uniref:Uncharacterized protein n=1 Tax=Jimgerdemannia flammicorona TaxID=994334 RepID=A0A433D813_9FUNG|nr:hypothetical protein BC936DRAFT_146320 [Jimgerdemannia flammicorona]